MVNPRRERDNATPAQTSPGQRSSRKSDPENDQLNNAEIERHAAQQVESLIGQLETGSAIAEAKLVGLSRERTREEPTDSANSYQVLILNGLAQSAANGSPYSMELLLRFVVEQQLAAPAIASVTQAPSVFEDIYQEVLVAISDSIQRFRGDAKFTTWLYTLARNVSVSHLRRQRSNAAFTDTDPDEADRRRRMSSLVVERDALRDAIAELPEKYRDTIVMRDVQGLSYAEIAERQGLEISTVRTRLHRGRAMLAIKLP